MGSDAILYFHRQEPVNETFVREFFAAIDTLPFLSASGRADALERIESEAAWTVTTEVTLTESNEQSFTSSVGFSNTTDQFSSRETRYYFSFYLPEPRKYPAMFVESVAHLGPLFDRLDCDYGHVSYGHEGFPPPIWVGPETWWHRSAAMFFGPDRVAEIGFDRLMELPVAAVREYSEGSVAVVAPDPYCEAPATLATPNVRRAYCTGRLPDPPLSFDDDAPSEMEQALSGLDGWHPEERWCGPGTDDGRLESWYRDRLTSDSPRVRASAVRTLDWLDALSWDDCDRLAATADGDTLQPFVDESPVVRAEFLRSSLPIQWDSTAVEWAKDALTDDDHRVRYAAVKRLANFDHRDVARKLTVRVRDDDSPRVRAAALDALWRMDRSYAPAEELTTVAERCFERESAEQVLAAALDLAGRVSAVPLILDGLAHESQDVRAAAISALASAASGIASQVDQFVPLLGHDDVGVAFQSANALAQAITRETGPDVAAQVVEAMEEADDPTVRAGAVWVLDHAGTLNAGHLRTAITDDHARVRATAVESLSSEPAVGQFAGLLADQLRSSESRRELDAVGRALRTAWTNRQQTFPVRQDGLRDLLGDELHPRGRAAAVALSGAPDGTSLLRDTADTTEKPRAEGAALAGLGQGNCATPQDWQRFESRWNAESPFVQAGAFRGTSYLIAGEYPNVDTDAGKEAIRRTLREHASPVLTRALVASAERTNMAHEVSAALLSGSLSQELKICMISELEVISRGAFERYPSELYRITDRSVFEALVATYQPVVADDGRPPAGVPWEGNRS